MTTPIRPHQWKRQPRVHINSAGKTQLRPGILRCSCMHEVSVTGDVNPCATCGARYSFAGVRLDPAEIKKPGKL